MIAGRKGSGKSALFFQVRNKLRDDKRNVVLDLHPEGFQLRKLKALVLDQLEVGTREHSITALGRTYYYESCARNCSKKIELATFTIIRCVNYIRT